MSGFMNETTGQGTYKLPRRLPKQPNQLFYTEASEPIAEAPSAPQGRAAEELLPVFEIGPDLPDTSWPEFPPQEFTAPEERSLPPQEPVFQDDYLAPAPTFTTQDEYVAPLREFILTEDIALPTREFLAPIEIPARRPHVPQPPPTPQSPEQQSPRDPAPGDSKPDIGPVGDPKPAFARPSGLSRSRPSRPSGTLSAARLSGSFPIPEVQRESFVADELRHSRNVSSDNVPVADRAPRTSGQVVPVDYSTPEAPSSRVSTPTRRRRSASAVPALIVLSILLVGYSFAVGPIESYLESQLIGSSGPSGTLMTLVPWIALTPVILLLVGVLWIIAGLIGLRRVKPRAPKSRAAKDGSQRKRKKERRKSPLELFREEAAAEDIDGDAAYQCWRLLQPFGPDNHVLSVFDELEGTLGMRSKDVQSIYQQLVPPTHKDERYHFRTVLDLLRVVRQASLSRA